MMMIGGTAEMKGRNEREHETRYEYGRERNRQIIRNKSEIRERKRARKVLWVEEREIER